MAPKLENYKFWIITPQEAINQYPNPRLDPPDYGEDLTTKGTGYSSSKTAAEQRRGSYCMDIATASSTLGGVYYSGLMVENGLDYVFSCDIKATAGEKFTIDIRNARGIIKGSTLFTAIGYWQRVECTAQADEDSSTWRIYITRSSTVTGTNHFYIDGLQFEEGTKATTFIHGYAGGGKKYEGYYWEGAARNSHSVRTNKTGMGGRLLDISDYATLAGVYGLGMGNYSQIMTSMANGGELYQRHVLNSRMFTLKLHYIGSMSEITEKRKVILDAVRPDVLPGKEMVIRYQGFDNNGDEATDPIDIICVPQSSHTDPPNEPAMNEDLLTFTIPSGLLNGAYAEGGELSLYDELAVEGVVMRDVNGNWNNMNGGIDNGYIYCMAEAPNGDIYIGGTFTSVNGVANTAYLAKWDGSAWSTVTGANTLNDGVFTLLFDAAGNLFIGGNFTDLGDANGDSIVKWDGASLTSLGGMDGTVTSLAIDPHTGYLYAGGAFQHAGGISALRIAYWDGAAWHAMDTGLNGNVYALEFAPDGNLYIGGQFSDAAYPYLCYWNGSTFNPVGTAGDISGIVQSIKFDNNGNLIIAGNFTNVAGNIDIDYITKWNGTHFVGLGSGVNDIVYELFISDTNEIYCSGLFTSAGDLTLSDRIAIYRNGGWHSIDIDLPGSNQATAILVDSRGNLYIGGNFSTATDGNAITGIASNIEVSSASANSYPYIQLVGPGVLQSITNYTTGKSIQFNGLTLLAGEWVNLQCNPHNIKFESGWPQRGNLMRYVIPGSNIADFYLKPGINNISVLMPSGTDSNTAGFIHWTPKFWSIEGAKHA